MATRAEHSAIEMALRRTRYEILTLNQERFACDVHPSPEAAA
jgi:hypothetical protein